MNEYRNLAGNITSMARFATPDTRLEKLFRLVLSRAVIVLGLYSVNQGYEVAYSDGEFNPLLRPDGNGDHYFFDMIGVLAWTISLLGSQRLDDLLANKKATQIAANERSSNYFDPHAELRHPQGLGGGSGGMWPFSD